MKSVSVVAVHTVCMLKLLSCWSGTYLKYLCNLARYWLQAPWWWQDSVETCRSVIICEIIVHLLVIVQNDKRCTVQRIDIIHGVTSRTRSIFTVISMIIINVTVSNCIDYCRHYWYVSELSQSRIWGEGQCVATAGCDVPTERPSADRQTWSKWWNDN